MQIEEAIEDIKLSKSTVLFGREQTIVNIEAIETVLNELEKKDRQIEASNQEHKYDVEMIDEVKGEAVKLYKEIREKEKVIDAMAEDILHYINERVEFDFEKYKDIEEVKEEYYEKAEEK